MRPSDTPLRADYPVFYPISTRWSDNDIYGHINNVVYYSYFDSVANQYLIEEGGLRIPDDPVVGYVVNSGCNYLRALAYPDRLEGGLRVEKLGNSSVRYGIGVFRQGEDTPAAFGHFVHVFVDRASNRSVPIPEGIRAALARIAVD
ncbi:MAG: thioesterase family protein [Halieaceae bacterium]|nr:thioesterase family protein [Halieaceae bacterium]